MKRFWLIPLVIVLLVVLVFSGCSSNSPTPTQTTSAPTTSAPTTSSVSPTPTKQEVIELSYNINYNATQLPAKYCYYFADQVNKQSNGRVKMTVYPAGTL